MAGMLVQDAVALAAKRGKEDRESYIAEFGERPLAEAMGDWDSTAWAEVWRTICVESDFSITGYNACRLAYLTALFATKTVS